MERFRKAILLASVLAIAGGAAVARDADRADLLIGSIFPSADAVTVDDVTSATHTSVPAPYGPAFVPVLRFVFADSRRWWEWDVELNGFQTSADAARVRVINVTGGFAGAFDLSRRRTGTAVWRGTAGVDVGPSWARIEITGASSDLPQATVGVAWGLRFGVRRAGPGHGPDWLVETRWTRSDVRIHYTSLFSGATTRDIRTTVQGIELLTGMAARF